LRPRRSAVRPTPARLSPRSPELTGTPQARDAARFLLVKPPLPLTEAVLVRPAGQLAVNTIRWGLSARAPADA
jgi:hypothetical protein